MSLDMKARGATRLPGAFEMRLFDPTGSGWLRLQRELPAKAGLGRAPVDIRRDRDVLERDAKRHVHPQTGRVGVGGVERVAELYRVLGVARGQLPDWWPPAASMSRSCT